MQQAQEVIKQYDRLLYIKKNLDGTKAIHRKSIFKSNEEYPIFSIQNQFIGSGRWLRSKLISMDNQRNDLILSAANYNIQKRKQKEDTRITREIASFITSGGESFIN